MDKSDITHSKIPFNRPMYTGEELDHIQQVFETHRKFSGNGEYTKKCQQWFEKELGAYKTLLTTSCTSALEMAGILADLKPGDEVIMPAFTFVSTANAYLLRGATVRFADSEEGHPNMCVKDMERLINKKTKAIVPVHYAGVACEMDPISELARSVGAVVIEDAAQAQGSTYKGKALGTLGEMGAFSFHETKNINCGEGGALCVNDSHFVARAEIIWEKGTNRAAFFRGEVAKYNWVDIGSSFLPSELNAACLYPQLLKSFEIKKKRVNLWKHYQVSMETMEQKEWFRLPQIGSDTDHNGHIFYMVCRSLDERSRLIEFLKQREIYSFFHYQSLHRSPYFSKLQGSQRELPNVERYSDCLLRLPMFFELTTEEVNRVVQGIEDFYKTQN